MAGEEPDNTRIREAFKKAGKWLYDKGSFEPEMLREKPVAELIRETADLLYKGISFGLGEELGSGQLAGKMKDSAFVFSGFKTFHEMNEAAQLLTDENGNMKPFSRFAADIEKIDENYNRIYLRAEYNFAKSSAAMAARWKKLTADGDSYNLQYRTSGDDKVRESHQALNGITLPPSDPFWADYFPPNAWNCRCTVVRVLGSKYEQTDHAAAIAAGETATSGKHQDMFRFNAGKQESAFPSYNSYTIRSCNGCDKNSLKLARPANQLCAACAVIQRMKCAETDAKEWGRRNIDEKKGLDISGKNFASGSISVRRSSVKDIIGHTRDLNVIQATPEILQNSNEWRYIGWAPVQKDARTGKRKHPEAEYFLYYEVEIAGVKRYVNVKAHYTHKREVPYCILDKCNQRKLKEGIPPGIDKYKKKQGY